MTIHDRDRIFKLAMDDLANGGTLLGALEAVYEAGFTTGFKLGFDGEQGNEAENGRCVSSQSSEASARLSAVCEVVDKHLSRLQELLAMNQNPGCGGDGSISEQQWYNLRDMYGTMVWISSNSNKLKSNTRKKRAIEHSE